MAALTVPLSAVIPGGAHLAGSVTVQIVGTLVGSDRSPVNTTLYPKNRYFRVYSPAGSGIKQPSTTRGILYHVSFKDTPTATLVNNWLAALPSRAILATPSWRCPYDVLLEYNHEPEGDMASTTYKTNVGIVKTALAAWNAAHPSGPTVGLAQTFTRYAQVHGQTMTDGVAATVANLWCGADVIGLDCEKDTTQFPAPSFPDVATFFAVPLSLAASVGKPLLVPELGWPQQTTDPNGTALAAWYTAAAGYLQSHGCAAVAAYDTSGSTADYTLSGAFLTAWQTATAAQ